MALTFSIINMFSFNFGLVSSPEPFTLRRAIAIVICVMSVTFQIQTICNETNSRFYLSNAHQAHWEFICDTNISTDQSNHSLAAIFNLTTVCQDIFPFFLKTRNANNNCSLLFMNIDILRLFIYARFLGYFSN